MNRVLYILCCLVFCGVALGNAQEKEMDELWGGLNNNTVDKKTLFSEGNYAMFIHWGIYSELAGVWQDTTYYGISEFLMDKRRAGIPVDVYKKQASKFNPENFNPDEIVKLAKDAGMKYIIITAKHIDGFAMYDSKVSDFNIVKATPYGKDPMKALQEACEREGLGFGFYYAQYLDWTFPGGKGGPTKDSQGNPVDFGYYFENKCLPQVREITQNYGDLTLLWFDTPGQMERKYVEKLIAEVKKNQPNALVSGRVGHGLGDYNTFGDMHIPVLNVDGLWESVDVTNDSWGYTWYDKNWKTPKQILINTISTIARGGTYMLNIGPKGDGSIPKAVKASLESSGSWIKRHPSVIYGARPSPWKKAFSWGEVTVHSNTIQLCIFDWPENGKLEFYGLENKIVGAKLQGEDETLSVAYNQENKWTTVNLPFQKPEKLINVVTLEVKGQIKVDDKLVVDPVYKTELPVEIANENNVTIEGKRWMEKFGEWKHVTQAHNWIKKESYISWEVNVNQPGYYQTELRYAGNGRMVWKIESSHGEVVQNEQGSSSIYTNFPMGWIKFDKAGVYELKVRLMEGDTSSASLEGLYLEPIEF
ncbi:alpha-L-fucosidase [Joostella atrarenae]|uniref:alpha-L-fucosidase n=1 Tax=Joostella atrarenae TaxID=679257 RepID=A0ABS9J068_9FLAO|nr:alpha-L-fucosidase [Joostella atrarenae]MCF8713825.1 alpha-L-fucosidase [Joostella atrarenae]